MKKRNILVIGGTNNIWVNQTARDFTANDYNVTLVSHGRPNGTEEEPFRVFDLKEYPLSFPQKCLTHTVIVLVQLIDVTSFWISLLRLNSRYEYKRFKSSPTLKRAVVTAIVTRIAVRHTPFDLIYCHHAYFYGLAGVAIGRATVIVHPWGSDIHRYAISSPFRYFVMKWIFKQADYLVVGSIIARNWISTKFNVSLERVHVVNYTVYRNSFFLLEANALTQLKASLQVSPNRTIVFSCRRFIEGWGPDTIRRAFIKAAQFKSNLFFIVLSGLERNSLIDLFEEQVTQLGLSGSFKFLKREINLVEYAQYSQVSNYIVSAMTNQDMRSHSILQAVACGAFPILSKQDEYDEMVKEGFNYVPFDGSADTLYELLVGLDDSAPIRLIEANSDYIDKLNDTNYVGVISSIVSKEQVES